MIDHGNWNRGNHPTEVVSDKRPADHRRCGPLSNRTPAEREYDEQKHYGGHLIAESILSEQTARLIQSAPELYRACVAMLEFYQARFREMPLDVSDTIIAMEKAVAAAEGREPFPERKRP